MTGSFGGEAGWTFQAEKSRHRKKKSAIAKQEVKATSVSRGGENVYFKRENSRRLSWEAIGEKKKLYKNKRERETFSKRESRV